MWGRTRPCDYGAMLSPKGAMGGTASQWRPCGRAWKVYVPGRVEWVCRVERS